MRIESTILNHLLHDDSYARKVIPFLKEKYFVDSSERLIFKQIESFVSKYNSLPTKEALSIELNNLIGVGESEHKQSLELIDSLTPPEKVDETWLLNTTEKFCQEKAVYNAIMDSIHILDGKELSLRRDDKNHIALQSPLENHDQYDCRKKWQEHQSIFVGYFLYPDAFLFHQEYECYQ